MVLLGRLLVASTGHSLGFSRRGAGLLLSWKSSSKMATQCLATERGGRLAWQLWACAPVVGCEYLKGKYKSQCVTCKGLPERLGKL